MFWDVFRLSLTLTALLLLPGWALLALSGLWRRWEGLQRWIVAVSLSIAFYPVLFYGLRFIFPQSTLGPYKMGAFLCLCAILFIWRMRHTWRQIVRFDHLEWIALGVFGMTLFIRFWVIRDQPYPAWSDSLHHTLLTQLTAVQGHLPMTLEPYFPVPLQQYHLGLYALSGTVQWLARVPAHTALLWTAQAMNGLCGIGTYFVLDRKVGRIGAIVGAAMVGLFAHHPAFYVNWGRFTQVAGQVLLLPAWLVAWEAMRASQNMRKEARWLIGFAALLAGGMFLLHFRVAIFYALLLGPLLLWEVWRAYKAQGSGRVLLAIVLIGSVTLLVITPAVWSAGQTYLQAASNQKDIQPEYRTALQRFYDFPLESWPDLMARPWLLVVVAISFMLGMFVRHNKFVGLVLLWTLCLFLLGYAYVLDIPFLNVTNFGAVAIMLYLPFGLVVGAFSDALWRYANIRWMAPMTAFKPFILVAFSLLCFISSHVRVTELEPFRYFVTQDDVAAMHWIEQYTPSDALFAVNTEMWLSEMPHGTDAGYWIPYFTNRSTTAGVMLSYLNPAHFLEVAEMSRAVKDLEQDPAGIIALRALGVDYIYVGQKGHFSGPGLNVTQLKALAGITLVYEQGGVFIFAIQPQD